MKRREFLAASVGCACFMLAESGVARTVAAMTTVTGPVKVGALKSFTREGIDDRFLDKGFFLMRGKEHLYALSAFCTHKTDSRLNGRPGEEMIVCPRHHAQFTLDGAVTRGPAKRDLPRFAIAVDGEGQVTVDTSKTVEPGRAGDPSAFVKVG